MSAIEGGLSTPSSDEECISKAPRVHLMAPPTIYRDCLAHMLATYGAQMTVSERLDTCGDRPDVLLLDFTRGYVEPAVLQSDLASFQVADKPVPIVIIADLRAQFDVIREKIDRVVACIPSSLTVRGTLSALRFAGDGGSFAPLHFLDACGEPQGRALERDAGVDHVLLTPRERQIIHLLRCGKPNKTIAHELAISLSTVKVHIHNIMKKCNSRNRTQVALLNGELNGELNGINSSDSTFGHENSAYSRIANTR